MSRPPPTLTLFPYTTLFRSLARAVAVLGDPAEPALAAQLAGLDEDAAPRAADALAEAVIFEPGRRLAFVHPRSEEHTSDPQSRREPVCRLLLEKQTPPTSPR